MRVHFIGIGGIGVSALAQYYLKKNYKVSGSDLSSSEIIDLLEKKGAKIFIGQSARNITENIDLIIYSPAVKKDNPEFKEAKRLKIKCLSYPEALGELTKKHFTIAVSGTHGKSTTTAMLALVLIKAGLDPTVVVGTKLKEFSNSNFRMGKSKYLLIEACEHEESFLNYWPRIIVITNIEREHLDYYENLKNIMEAFKKFISHLPKNGLLVINKEDKNITKLLNCSTAKLLNIKNFSIKRTEAKKLQEILKVPGEHNIYDALAALTVARELKIPDKTSFKALSEFKGTWRRFDISDLKIKNYKLKIIYDYAHHPTEIKATLKAAREKFPSKKIWCLFQPHQYQRTYFLFNDFVNVFAEAVKEKWIDRIIISQIYDVAGRENKKIKKKISSQKLVKEIGSEKISYISSIEDSEEYLRKKAGDIEILIVMGAGDVYKVFHR